MINSFNIRHEIIIDSTVYPETFMFSETGNELFSLYIVTFIISVLIIKIFRFNPLFWYVQSTQVSIDHLVIFCRSRNLHLINYFDVVFHFTFEILKDRCLWDHISMFYWNYFSHYFINILKTFKKPTKGCFTFPYRWTLHKLSKQILIFIWFRKFYKLQNNI